MSSSRPTAWEQLGDYKLLGKFARGQSCALHLALYPGAEAGSQLRAVKMPLPEYVSDANFTNLLVGEAQLLACMQHPNVLAAHGFGRERGGYVALDYVEGDDFQTLQASGRGAPEPRIVLAIIADVLQGLDALHGAVGEVGDPLRAVHQAPTARHILVGTDGRARLADFTHARVQRPLSERRRSSRLEPAHRAPEQIQTPDLVDARTDLFVLGIAFWEALTGRGLFAAGTSEQTTQNVLAASVPTPSAAGAMSNALIDQVCLRALARDPQQRWSSAKEMLLAVLDVALAIGGIALPAEVGRWVGIQASAQLQVRRALAGGVPPSAGTARAAQSIPPPAAAFGRSGQSEKLDLSKTLMGTGLSGLRGEGPRPGAQPAFQPTVLAETEPGKPSSFRPSRPSSSRPPGSNAAGSTAPGATSAAAVASATSSSSAPPAASPAGAAGDASDGIKRTSLLPTGVAPLEGVIDTEGVELSPRPTFGKRGRITEEYAVSERPAAIASSSASPAPLARHEPGEGRSRTTSPELAAPARAAAPAAGAPREERTRAAVPSPQPLSGGTPHRGNSTPVATSGSSEPGAKPNAPRETGSRVDAAGTPARPSRSGTEPARGSHPPGRWRPGGNDLFWMSLFAVLTVVAGDTMIRLCFGSPYGEPRVPPLADAAAAGPR
jgi:serine/threonine-protein kinase